LLRVRVYASCTSTDVINCNGGLTGFFGIFCCKKWLTTMRRSTRTAPDRAEYTKPALPVLVCSLDEYGLMIRQMLVKPSIWNTSEIVNYPTTNHIILYSLKASMIVDKYRFRSECRFICFPLRPHFIAANYFFEFYSRKYKVGFQGNTCFPMITDSKPAWVLKDRTHSLMFPFCFVGYVVLSSETVPVLYKSKNDSSKVDFPFFWNLFYK